VKRVIKNKLTYGTGRSLFFVLVILVFFHPIFIWSSTDYNPDEYVLKAWTIEEGLPQNSVLSILQSCDGYMWFGTQLGLVRFDGMNFRIYNRWNTNELKNDSILCLYEDSNGQMWIGTNGGGICRINDGQWNTYTVEHGLSNNHVRVIFEDSKKNIWIGTDFGLNCFKDGVFRKYTVNEGLSGNSIASLGEDKNGRLWVGTINDGLNVFKDGNLVSSGIGSTLSNKDVTIIFRDQSGQLWIGTEAGLFFPEINSTSKLTLVEAGISQVIRAIKQDLNGNLWIGTDGGGLFRYKDGHMTNVFTQDAYLGEFVCSIEIDFEGNLWVGTYTSGVVQLKKSKVTSLTVRDGLPENYVQAVYKDPERTLWIGTKSSGICTLDESKRPITFKGLKNVLPSHRITAFMRDRNNTLWIGTDQGCVAWKKNGESQLFTRNEGLPSDKVNVICQGKSPGVWIGTNNGLSQLIDGEFITYNKNSGIPRAQVNVLLEDKSGCLWVGTRKGLFFQKNGSFQSFTYANKSFTSDVLSMYEDSKGYLWFGTNGSGLFLLKEGKLSQYTTRSGLYNNYIFSILEDEGGNLWMSSYRGVFRVSKKDLEQNHGKSRNYIFSVSYDENDGMMSSVCAVGGQPAAYKGEKGELYFSTVRGISIFYPQSIEINTKPPKVMIEDVIVDNRSLMNLEKTELPDDSHMFEFYFTGMSYVAPGKLKFKVQLEGYDSHWIDVVPPPNKQRRAALYFNLPPGDYRFRVIACNRDGYWNEEGPQFSFSIRSPFFKRNLLFILLFLIFLIAAVGYLVWKKKPTKTSKLKTEAKYKTSALVNERVDEILPKLMHLVEVEKVYLSPDLTLKKLSEKLMIHYNHLSQIINDKLDKSFSDFINMYRIEEAKKRLEHPKESKKTVLEIAYDTGFYSKSVFNTAFKKFTGKTPSQYKKEYSKKK
jgi:ligand-binding sensor domain-containing protein/AraC-like DNA-binding protein